MNDFSTKEYILEDLKGKLKKSRFLHTIGVSDTAACLAMRYHSDVEAAILAGLLHDCAKGFSKEEQLALVDKYSIKLNEAEQLNHELIHAKLGAKLANEIYKVDSKEIINSIRYHTTGRPEMTLLEKILYVADYIEPNRYKQKRLDLIRRVAFEDIDKCIKMITEDTLDYLKETNSPIDPLTEETYKYYAGESNGRN